MESHKLGLGSRVVFWVVKIIDGANIDSTCDFEPEISSCTEFVWAILLDRDIPIVTVFNQ